MGLFTRTKNFFRKKKTFYGNEFLYKFLRNGGASELMSVNGAITPVVFEYVVPEGKDVWIERMNIMGHNNQIIPDDFFGITKLANGLLIQALDDQDNLLIDFNDGVPIQETIQWSLLAGTDTRINNQGANEDAAVIRWTLSKAGEPLFMRAGYKFRVTVQDDLTTIPHLSMMIQGMVIGAY